MNIDPNVFVQYGILGVVLAWFMFRVEKKMDAHTLVINDLVISNALAVLSRNDVPQPISDQASELLNRATARKPNLRE